MKEFVSTFKHAMHKGHRYHICVSYQDPYTNKDLREIRAMLPQANIGFMTEPRKVPKGPLFNFVEARIHSLSLVNGMSDYIIWCDDDFRFTDGASTKLGLTAGQRYQDAIDYLEANPACGIVQMTGHLGGSQFGRKVIPIFGGFMETALGLVLRGRKRGYKDLIDPRLKVIGGGSDPAVMMTAVANGYYIAKTFNTPINKDHTKKLFVANGKSKVNLTDDPSYNHEYLIKKGVHAKISELFGEYRHGKKFSKEILATYRKAATAKGIEVLA